LAAVEMANGTFDNSPLTRGKERRWLEAQNQRTFMSFVVENSSTDRIANEHAPCLAKFVGGLIELAKRLIVNLE
jgi:hypothetical protein